MIASSLGEESKLEVYVVVTVKIVRELRRDQTE